MGTQQTKGRGPTRDGGGDRERLGLRVHAATDNRQERGPRGRRRHNTTTTTAQHDDDDHQDSLRYAHHQHRTAMAEKSGHLGGQFGREVAGPLDVHLLQCQHRLQTGYPSIGPVHPVLLAPSSRDHHRPGHQAPSQASPGLESRQPRPSTSTSTDPSHLESPSPPKIQRLQLAKVRTKRRLASGTGTSDHGSGDR